jgi:hypothetical protein
MNKLIYALIGFFMLVLSGCSTLEIQVVPTTDHKKQPHSDVRYEQLAGRALICASRYQGFVIHDVAAALMSGGFATVNSVIPQLFMLGSAFFLGEALLMATQANHYQRLSGLILERKLHHLSKCPTD